MALKTISWQAKATSSPDAPADLTLSFHRVRRFCSVEVGESPRTYATWQLHQPIPNRTELFDGINSRTA